MTTSIFNTSDRIAEVKATVDALRSDFPEHAYLLFAAGLLLHTGDYEQLLSDSVLDGPDDKKIDLFHVDREAGRVIVVQAYEPSDWPNGEPPANKASDLNTASTWLLDANLETISRSDIRAAAEDLRDALEAGEVSEVAFYYVHAGRPSVNVQTELNAVRDSLQRKLQSWAGKTKAPLIGIARELSLTDIVQLYESRHGAITVTEEIILPTDGTAQTVRGNQWRGAAATVQALHLVNLAKKHGDALTSANIRDYLGRRSSARNINQQIRRTAEEEPNNFWVYNNGLTLITRRFQIKSSSLVCNGLAVTNGAQTLGSLSDVTDVSALKEARIPVRIIESDDPALIENIIRFNNTQNPIKPWELRVLDPVQMRIKDDFGNDLNITYQFRRGASRSSVQYVHLSKLAPWLAAFNGDPIRAHRNSPELFGNEQIYRSLFNEESNARHLLAVYRIGEAFGQAKDRYRSLVNSGQATPVDEQLYGYFRYGAFTTAVIYFASEVLVEILGSSLISKNQIRLQDEYEGDRQAAIEHLQRLVEFTLAPIPSELEGSDGYAALRTDAGIKKIRQRILVTVRQLRALQEEAVSALSDGLTVA